MIKVISFLLFALLIQFINSQNSRNLCDFCDCIPTNRNPSQVNCNCRKTKVLILKEEHSEVLSNTQILNISNCSFLSFQANGFQNVTKLKKLEIHQMKLFHFNAGIFPTIESLIIHDVDEVIVDGFQGQTYLSNIDIKRSFISEIVEDTFKYAKTLRKIMFNSVSIGVIASMAMDLTDTDNRISLSILNSRIDAIRSDGLIINNGYKVEMVNTSINMIDANAIMINASDSIEIADCKFGAILAEDGFTLNSNSINIIGNEFASLPSSLLRDITITGRGKKIKFQTNFIHDIDLGGFLLNSKLDQLNFSKNRIICDCSPRKTSILKLKQLFPGLLTNESYFDGIIENNNCQNYGGIYLSDFKHQFLNGLICNDSDVNSLQTIYSNEPTEKLLSLLQQPSTTATTDVNKSTSLKYNFFISSFSFIFFTFLA